MSTWMFWKLFGDACLYFSVIGALPTLFVHDASFLWPALLCGIGGAAASWLSNRGKGNVSGLAVLIPLLGLLFADQPVELLSLIPPVIYTLIVILRGDFALEYLSFRDFFRKSMIAWVIFFVLLFLACTVENITQTWRRSLAFEETLEMGVFYAVCGVILQRQLRLGNDGSSEDRKRNSIQSAAVLGGTGAVVLSFWAFQQFLAEHAKGFMNALGELLLYICTLPLTLIVWILAPLIEEMTGFYEETQPPSESTEETLEHIVTVAAGETTEPVANAVDGGTGYPWWLVVLILSLLLILLLVGLKLYRKKAADNALPQSFAKADRPERRSAENGSSNRAKVRRYYREHLKLEQRRGMRLGTNQTSADILEKISDSTDEKAAAALRQVYLKARYDDTGSVTNEDVQRAKTAIKQLRK